MEKVEFYYDLTEDLLYRLETVNLVKNDPATVFGSPIFIGGFLAWIQIYLSRFSTISEEPYFFIFYYGNISAGGIRDRNILPSSVIRID